MTRIATAMAALLMLASAAAGQTGYAEESVFDDYLDSGRDAGFMSIPGLNFNSSMGFAYQSSGSYGSGGFGYYMGHFSYRLSSDLTLRWDVGIRSSMTGPDAGENMQLFLPNVDLTYRPSERFMVRLQFNQYSHRPYYFGGRR